MRVIASTGPAAGFFRREVADRDQEPIGRPTRIAACVALALVALPATLAAGVLRLSLGRPLLFRQTRAGRDGRPFTIVKFRTMHDSRDAGGQLLPDGDRQTAAARLIRRLRLDEAPQLLSILGGDMAFVGPRPLPPEIVASFGRWGQVRVRVRPGLTGWAQVNGNTRLSDADKLALDIWYVDHRSLALDARILLMTLATLVTGERPSAAAIAAARWHLDLKAAEFAPEPASGDRAQ